ncbi:M28 family peptidase [Stygiolobus caldivivus]|uniref:Zn-dependent exopeptidase M28 n=1 Tax=Stygiolobus caldivivus TaxID=2824673 RepID=A0A8D5U7G7_9CREN|nr:M28 family peptidase [Stygiolobus caldivivus]BCU70632.1 Zn-dependent exopeptidase M28 [Stygiolobus caldivivus]
MGIYEKVKELSRFGEIIAGGKKEKKILNVIKSQFEDKFDDIKLYYHDVLNWSSREAEIQCESKKVPDEYFAVLPYSPSVDIETSNYRIISLNSLSELSIKYARIAKLYDHDTVLLFTLNDDTIRKIVLKNRPLLHNSPQTPPYIPAFFINKNTLNYLKGKCRFYMKNTFMDSVGFSIEGISNGKKDEKVYVTAHHDHWFYGEHDDLVGVALLSELNHVRDSNYEIHAISFTAEESGCYFESFSWACGSKQYVKNNREKLENTKLVISLDNISSNNLYLFYTPLTTPLKYEDVKEIPYPSPYSDSYRFLEINAPTISFHSLDYKYYHSNFDVLNREESVLIEQKILSIIRDILEKYPRFSNTKIEFIKKELHNLPVELKSILTNTSITNRFAEKFIGLYKSILYPNGKIITSLFHTLKGIKESYYTEYMAIEDFKELENIDYSSNNYTYYIHKLYKEEIERYIKLISENY